VTLLLSFAAQALVVPLERLNRDDADADSMKWWNTIKNEDICSCTDDLFKECVCKQWHYGDIGTTKDSRQLPGSKASWSRKIMKEPLSRSSKISVNQLLACIRNAISHGQVWSLGDPISELMFISNHPDKCIHCHREAKRSLSPAEKKRLKPVEVKWRGLIAPVEDVMLLIQNWCRELERLRTSFKESTKARSYELEEVGV